MRTGPSTMRGPFTFGVIVVSVMGANIRDPTTATGVYSAHGLERSVRTVYAGPHARSSANASQAVSHSHTLQATPGPGGSVKRSSLVVALAISVATTEAIAQSGTSVEAGVITALDDAAIVQLGFRVTAVKKTTGVDFAIATFPEGIASGLFLFTPDLDFAMAVPMGDRSWFYPRAGVSALVGVGGGGGGAVPGYNVGVGVMAATGRKMGLRLDVTYRKYVIDGETTSPLLVFSCGLSWLF